MPIVFKKITGESREDTARHNANYDRISQELADRSGVFSSVFNTSVITVSNGASQEIEADIVDVRDTHEVNKLPVIPRLNVFVNNNDDFTYSFPLGSNLTAAQRHGIHIDLFQSRTVLNQATNEKATVCIVLHNDSGSSVDFYLEFDAFYVPSPDIGVALRPAA